MQQKFHLVFLHEPLYTVLKEVQIETENSRVKRLLMARLLKDTMVHMIFHDPDKLVDLMVRKYGYPPEYARSLVEKMRRRYMELVTS